MCQRDKDGYGQEKPTDLENGLKYQPRYASNFSQHIEEVRVFVQTILPAQTKLQWKNVMDI